MPTYKKPRPNTRVRPIFSDVLVLSFQICGIGNTRIAISENIVELALATHTPISLMQWPGISGDQSFSDGTQIKVNRNVPVIAQATTKLPTAMTSFLKLGATWKTR